MNISSFSQFAAAQNSESGIGAFNINLKSFIFQLVTFVIVLLIFRRWILPPILKSLEDRRQTLEKSLIQAKQTEETLAEAETKAGQILHRAREQADSALAEARVQSRDIVNAAEGVAQQQASRILKENESQLALEKAKLRDELKVELADLVIKATERVLRTKLTAQEDNRLIEQAIKEITR